MVAQFGLPPPLHAANWPDSADPGELCSRERIAISRFTIFFHGMFDPEGRSDNQENDKTDQYQIKHDRGILVKNSFNRTVQVTLIGSSR